MWKRWTIARVPVLVGAALLTIQCTDTAGPDRDAPRPFAQVEPGSGIQLDQQNGLFRTTLNPDEAVIIIKGFNPTNPHVGDAILATFFWFGAPGGLTGNIIDSVTDVLTTTPYTPVGNKYELVEFVSDGTISMATYLATNVQNFPDAGTADNEILAVKADLKVPVTDGGIAITAWIGVANTISQALGEHRSASGPASLLTPTIADPGAIFLNAGALAYGVSLVSPPAGLEATPSGWTQIGTGGDLLLKDDAEYDARFTVSSTGGSTDPQWSWSFAGPGSWLATVLALNPAPTTGNLTVTTSTTGEDIPTSDYTVTLDGTTSQPIPPNGEITFTELQPGDHEVTLSGLPANCELTSPSSVTVTVVAGETATATFTVRCSAPPPPPPPPPATNLAFTTQPQSTQAGQTMAAVRVTARDDLGNPVTGFTGTITVALGANPGGGTLSGTTSVAAVNGVATFSTLSINNPGNGYTLVANATGLTGTTSAAFNITPAPATNLAFTTQPQSTQAGQTMAAVRVTARDDLGNPVTGFTGTITVALGANPGGGTLSGTRSVAAVNGVATFSTLSINNPGNGYTLVANATGLTGTTSAAFNITAPPPPPPPPPPPNDFVTGGGKLGDGREFATFGLQASPGGGKLEWVQHCPDGHSSASALCAGGKFTFHGTVTPGSYDQGSRGPRCRTWVGTGSSKETGARSFTVRQGCDGGEPGRGVDYIDVTIDGYQNSGYLTGGNIQLHRSKS